VIDVVTHSTKGVKGDEADPRVEVFGSLFPDDSGGVTGVNGHESPYAHVREFVLLRQLVDSSLPAVAATSKTERLARDAADKEIDLWKTPEIDLADTALVEVSVMIGLPDVAVIGVPLHGELRLVTSLLSGFTEQAAASEERAEAAVSTPSCFLCCRLARE
jgi:hypothetical protein